MMHANQCSQSPDRRSAEGDEKRQPDDAARHRALAPALEHSNHSNREQQNRSRSNRFHQHAGISNDQQLDMLTS
jgi:hypothetical protein